VPLGNLNAWLLVVGAADESLFHVELFGLRNELRVATQVKLPGDIARLDDGAGGLAADRDDPRFERAANST
jgi:hypothetical protein